MRVLILLAATVLAGCAQLLPITPVSVHEPPAAVPGTLEVHYVDVGQGDGVVWRFPDGTFVVYDCGESRRDEPNPVVDLLRELGAQRLHALIVSHGHADHAGGCKDVLDAFAVERVVDGWYEGDDTTVTYRVFKGAALDEGADLLTLRSVRGSVPLRAGDEIPLPTASGARAVLLWPEGPVARDWDDIARESLVVRLTFGKVSFCFQGDIEPPQEAVLAESGRDVACDVLLAGHHGSRAANTAAWLAAMDPEHAVVSFGENSYGHPTPEAVCRMQQAGAQVWFTHRVGTVTLRTDGESVEAPAGAETADYCAEGASYWPQP